MDIHIGSVVRLIPLNDACQRTKNRIREHGNKGFEIVSFNPGSWLFGGTPAVLVKALVKLSSDGNGGKERWRGWLPLLEIDSTK